MAPSDSSSYRIINLFDWTGGVRDQHVNPLFFPDNCLAGGENCEFSQRGLRTRKGFQTVARFSPWSIIKSLYQVRFPTSETKYLIAQVAQDISFETAGYPRLAHTAVADPDTGYIYIWGGGICNGFGTQSHFYGNTVMWRYNTADGTFTALADEGNAAGANRGGILVNGKIYFSPCPEKPWSTGTYCTQMAIYNIASNTWSLAATGGPVESWPVMLYDAGIIYVSAISGVYMYDIAGDSWTNSNAITADNIYIDSCVGEISGGYVCFYTAQQQVDGEFLHGYAFYEIATGAWTFSETTELPDWAPHWPLVYVDGRAYEWGTQRSGGNHPIDPTMKSWGTSEMGMTVHTPTPRDETTDLQWGNDYLGWGAHMGSVAHYNGKLYYFGGAVLWSSFGAAITADTRIYDIAADSWTLQRGFYCRDDGDTFGYYPGEAYVAPEMTAFNKLYACETDRPNPSLTFTEIYDLGADGGTISCAVLNERAVFTEGITNPPLVWGGCMAPDGSDWMYPKAVLVSQDGVNFYDVSSWVCDKDPDTVADIGGINAWGFLAICCDMPKVSAFLIDISRSNAGTGISTITEKVEFDNVAKVYREDLKGEIVRWIKDSSTSKLLSGTVVNLSGNPNRVKIPCADHGFFEGDVVVIANTNWYNGSYTLGSQSEGDANNFVIEQAYAAESFTGDDRAGIFVPENGGHFEGAQTFLSGAVVDMGGTPNKVRIPCVGHGFSPCDKITIRSTTNYDGTFILPDQTGGDVDSFIIESPFNSETFAAPSEAGKRIVLGSSSVIPGVLAQFADIDIDILAIRNTGEGDGAVALAADHDTADVLHVYGLDVQDKALCVNRPLADYVDAFVLAEDETRKFMCGGMHFRQVVPASALTTSGDRLRLTLHSGHDTTYGATVRHIAIGAHADRIKIPCANHGFNVGTTVTISGTLNYDGDYCLPAQTGGDANNIIILGTYATEAFGTAATITRTLMPAQQKSLSGSTPVNLGADAGFVTKGVPTPLLFNGAPGISIPVGETATTDFADFNIDETQSYIVIIDCEFQGTSYGRGTFMANGTLQTNILSGATLHYYYGATSAEQAAKLDSYDVADPTVGRDPMMGGKARWRNVIGQSANTVVGVFKIEVKQQQVLPTGLYVAVTADAQSVDISYAQSFQGVQVTQTAPAGTGMWHAVSLDSKQTFQVFLDDVWRSIVRQEGTIWQYKDATGAWQNASANTRLQALKQAFGIAENQMTGSQLAAITPEQWTADGGIVLYHTSNLDFAAGMQADGLFWPSLSKYGITYKSEGVSVTEGWNAGEWSQGAGWNDETQLFTRSGRIVYNGADPFKAYYSVLSEVPGFWYRIKMKGTSPGTSITQVRYQAPCQPLSNIGDGQPDTVLGFVHEVAETGNTVDWAVAVSDSSDTALSKADIALKLKDCLYVGYPTRFGQLEITPYQQNNTNAATMSGEYWNGEAWTAISIRDGTRADEATLAKKGKISWNIPEDWRTHIPLDGGFPRGYWLRFKASADLSPTTAITEVRVFGVPDPIKKHRLAACVRDRIALLNRPDAPDQVDLSRPLEEYGFCGVESGSYRVGGMDAIISAVPAWNGLFVGKAETLHQLAGTGSGDFGFQTIEAARHVPVNSQCIVKAPVDMGDGNRYGLFFLNCYGAFAASGLHVDSLWNSARGQLLSDSVTWWASTENPRLDLDRLHLAWGTYWPACNWILWSVPMITGKAFEQPINNRLIVYDLTFRTWLPPFSISLAALTTAYRSNPDAPGKLGSVELYGGDYRGRILHLFDSTQTTDDDLEIPGWMETGWLHFRSPECKKILRLLTLYGSSGENGVKLEVFVDGTDSPVHTSEFLGLSNLGERFFGEEQIPQNLAGKFIKFRLSFEGLTEIFGLQIGTSMIREWGAM